MKKIIIFLTILSSFFYVAKIFATATTESAAIRKTTNPFIKNFIKKPINSLWGENGQLMRAKDAMNGANSLHEQQVEQLNSRFDECREENCITENGGSRADPHLKTFDRVTYDFQAVGEFITVKSLLGGLEVQTRQGAWKDSTRASINTAVAVNVHQDKVVIFAEKDGLYINDLLETITTSKTLSNGGVVTANTGGYLITWMDGSSLQVSKRGGSTPYLDLELSLSDSHKSQIQGLLGNFDDDTANEFTTRQGGVISDVKFDSLYDVFGESWRITQAESLFVYFDGETTETFTNRLFPYASVSVDELPADQRAWAEGVCKGRGVTDSLLLNNCILDVALTGDEAFADSFIEQDSSVSEEVVVSGSRGKFFPYVIANNPIADFYQQANNNVVENASRVGVEGLETVDNKWLFASGYDRVNLLMTHPLNQSTPSSYTIKTNNKANLHYSVQVHLGTSKVEFIKGNTVLATITPSKGDWQSGSIALPANTQAIEMRHYATDWWYEYLYWSRLEAGD